MEDFKKLLEQNEDYLLSSSSENETDNESSLSAWDLKKYSDEDSFSKKHVLEVKCSDLITSKKRNGEKRLPTRRPDPNVYNRNALLARENRRKKKAYLETIEKELHFARKANHALLKALKRQLKTAKRLEKEKKYYEGLFANRSDLLSLVNVLNFRCIPESNGSPFSTSSSNGDNCHNVKRSTTSLSSNLTETDALSIHFDSPSDGSVTAPLESSLCDFSSFDFSTLPDFFTDLDNGTDCNLPTTTTTWDDIWGENGVHIDNLILPESTLMQDKSGVQSVNADHCYVMSSSLGKSPKQYSESSDYVDVVGDSSHIGIYCSSGNWNQACRTPPLQLLSDQSS